MYTYYGIITTMYFPFLYFQPEVGMSMLYKVGIDRLAGVVEAVHFYFWLVSKSWNSEK